MSQELINRKPDGSVDVGQFSEFEIKTMVDVVLADVQVMRKIRAQHAARGIYHEKGPDGNYRAVRRDNARR